MFGSDRTTTAAGGIIAINVGPAARDGQIVQDRPPMPLQRVEQPGGTLLPFGPAAPGGGVGAGPKPQPSAGRQGRQPAEDQPQPGRQQAAKHSPTEADPEDDGDPPGQGPGPGGPWSPMSPSSWARTL